ncbi:peptidyl-prolyl cis-trans isomerase [Brytella acorum]|uniref:Parvulin-like PPIase n=1 Tax=Brytella acorum TaxID=2959299 RepID=A0AA35UWL1_9PROT|nr:peptidyl-prolyl cis-trans isomerase [Brytella acorum]MDF3623904.1 SurA N-terminal domain-containing protein [Brytella acorum]CAI9120820.1 SurA N-terminal domain-containing protein [Brytella acorum]
MISTLRHVLVDSWIGRVLAFLIFAAFIAWGVGDIFTSIGASNADAVVRIGTHRITAQALSESINQTLPRAAQQMGLNDPSQVPQAERVEIAHEALQHLVTQEEVLLFAERNGMVAPDGLVRDSIFAIPAFHDKNGQFDRAKFNQLLAQRRLTEARVLDMARSDIVAQGVMAGLGDTMKVPPSITQRLIDFNARERVLDVVRINAGAMPAPTAPTDAQLHRYYDNHQETFRTTEYRHAKIVVLSADTVEHALEVPDEQLRRYYDFQSGRFHVPETRSLQVLTFQDEAKANEAAAFWKSGQSWDAMQAKYTDAAAVSLPETRQSDVPNPELAKAAFSAQSGTIEGPLKTETGWVLFRVLDIKAPHDTPFEAAREDLRREVAHQQAPALVAARMARFQDVIAGSSDLEHIPADLGAAPAAGTLDAQGMTHDGVPAPIPGDPVLRQAIIARVFSQSVKDKPSVVKGPKDGAFAVLVDTIEPGKVQPFDVVKARVADAWTAEQKRHAADVQATGLLTKAKSGGGVAKAVVGTPDAVRLQSGMTFSRVRPAALPDGVATQAFGAKIGESFMLNVGDDYYVATLTGERAADEKVVSDLRQRMEPQLTATMRDDVAATFVRGLEQRAKPVPNMALLQQVIDSTGGGAP